MTRVFRYFLSCCLAFSASHVAAERISATGAPIYTQWLAGAEGRHSYDSAVLRLAMEKSRDKFGDYVLMTNADRTNIERSRMMALGGDRYQIHLAPNDKVYRSHNVIFVEVPMLKGLLGYREMIIRSEDKARFESIETFEQLYQQRIKAGLGSGWPDVDVLRSNGIKVVETNEIKNLFAMLRAKRFDFIPLGINEIDGTLENYQQQYPELMIARKIVLFYPSSTFFVVHPDHPVLAERVEHGLKLAMADGSFDALFHEHFGTILENAKAHEPAIIHLENETGTGLHAASIPLLLE
jgi:hypothetical protein